MPVVVVVGILQVLSAASDIPATRFIGKAPGGLNATGESDRENYYNSIAAKQNHRLKPQLNKLLPVLGPSVLGNEFDLRQVSIDFPKLWNLNELDESTVRVNDTTNLVSMTTAGIISSAEAEAEARERGVLIVEPSAMEGALDQLANRAVSGGAWANKPTTDLFDGRTYFDTCLKEPYWYDSGTGTWYDASGAPHV